MFSLNAYQTTTILPDPQFSDGEGLVDEVNRIRATDGTLRTYIKRKGGRRKLQWSFALTRNKAIELEFFMKSYVDSEIRIVDHNARTWIGVFTTNPTELTAERKATPALESWPLGERTTVTLEFEGVEQ